MNAIVRLIDTVYAHIFELIFLCFGYRKVISHDEGVEALNYEVSDEVLEYDEDNDVVQTFKPVSEILKVKSELNVTIEARENSLMYVSQNSISLYTNPTIEYDAEVTQIPYGEMVMVLELKGRFCRVTWRKFEGWVLRDELVDRAIHVYPDFVIGQENSVDHPNTVRVRAILQDTFGLGHSEFSLQAGEYVLYKLWRRGIRISWPSIRPRTPGLWHKILRGGENIHIGMSPRVGSLMEYLIDDEIGHLSYVEAVFPDSTIVVSEANYPDSGIYNERELPKEVWKELKPVFITVN